MIDDHIIDSLRRYFDSAYGELKEEWISSKYNRLIDCPSFKTAHTYKEALNVLINGSNHADETELKKMIEEELQVENHWKHK